MSIAGRSKEELKDYLATYYTSNPDKYKQYQENNRKKVECLCGSTVSKHHWKEHLGTKKHQAYLNQQQES